MQAMNKHESSSRVMLDRNYLSRQIHDNENQSFQKDELVGQDPLKRHVFCHKLYRHATEKQ